MDVTRKQVTDGDIGKETVEVKRADLRLVQPPWADELEDAGSQPPTTVQTQHLRMHHTVPMQVCNLCHICSSTQTNILTNEYG